MAGIQCDPYESLYVKTEQIVCKVDGPGTKEPRRGPIIVKVADFRGESRDNYEFVDPQIRAIRPKRGPQSGRNTSVCLRLWWWYFYSRFLFCLKLRTVLIQKKIHDLCLIFICSGFE